ncbi:MAG: PBP1A family penicillin-binding protein [Hyphomicrobiales bacterium]|nr:PBP1A family penicillin-binding protein [Hyphomicrobiales bacterium]
MASRSKGRDGERIEPRFDAPGRRAPGDLRADPADAPPGVKRKGAAKRGARPAKPAPRALKRRRRGLFMRLVKAAFTLSIWGAIALAGLVAWEARGLPPIDTLAIPKRPPSVAIVASDGTPLAVRGDSGGPAVRLADLPPYLPKAFVAVEDKRFYSHFGIDPLGLARAAFNDLLRHKGLQGGSTLTQQLAKNLFLTQERTLSRKIQEAILAVWLERNYSKDRILELYVNRVYFGDGAYGVDEAARRYFGVPAAKVSIAQAAMLAGLMRAPTRLAPNRNPKGAVLRAAVVVADMRDQGYITPAQAREALAHPAFAVKSKDGGAENYVADFVTDRLYQTLGAVDSDVVVRTTISAKAEAAAALALKRGVDGPGAARDVTQGALVALATDGGIVALVGGRDYAESQFDRAVAAKRQPGSSFKPFVYLAALERGLTPDTVRVDKAIDVGGWRPGDFERHYLGPVTLTQALSKSINTVAVQLAVEVGPKRVAEVAHRLGIASDLQANATIALGTSEVTPLELVDAYAPFANGGYAVDPYVILDVKTTDGKTLYARKRFAPDRVVDSVQVGMMNEMLRQTIASGTARAAALPGLDAAGKTGTSQGFRDAWFVGYDAKLVTGVWVGNDDDTPMRGVTGGSIPAGIWRDFMAAVGSTYGGPVALPGAVWRKAAPLDLASGAAPPAAVPGRNGGPAAPPRFAPPAPIPAAPRRSGLDGLIHRLFGG